jgi:TatD DNase family protein
MNFPGTSDFIDIHTHGAGPLPGIFCVNNLMAHEKDLPHDTPGMTFTAGIHPWYLDEGNRNDLLEFVRSVSGDSNLAAIGEAGFDKLRGPSIDLQRTTFEEQAVLAKVMRKPLVIHCVRSWDELLAVYKRVKPEIPWMIHGFRGRKELASQLLSCGMYLSFWFDFIVRPEATELVKAVPKERIFLETDGADVDIRDIYSKVAVDLAISIDDLKKIIFDNFKILFVNENRSHTHKGGLKE